MTQWYIYFKSERSTLNHFLKELNKNGHLDFVKINNKEVRCEKLPALANIERVDIDRNTYSFLYTKEVKNVKKGTRCTTISIVGADYGLDANTLKTIEIAGRTLKPFEVQIVCEEKGPQPIYKGMWDFGKFKKLFLKEIEFNKKRK